MPYVGSIIADDTFGLGIDGEGWAKLRVDYDGGMFHPFAVVDASQLVTSGSISDSDIGYLFGVGLGYRYARNLPICAELLQYHYVDCSGTDLSATTVEVRVSYRF